MTVPCSSLLFSDFLMSGSFYFYPTSSAYPYAWFFTLSPISLATTSCLTTPPTSPVFQPRSVIYHFNNSLINTPKSIAVLQTSAKEQYICPPFLTPHLCYWGLLKSHSTTEFNASTNSWSLAMNSPDPLYFWEVSTPPPFSIATIVNLLTCLGCCPPYPFSLLFYENKKDRLFLVSSLACKELRSHHSSS